MVAKIASDISSFLCRSFEWVASIGASEPVSGEIAEWASDDTRCRKLVEECTPLPTPLVGLVVQYLKKSDLIGREELEIFYGKEAVQLCAETRAVLPKNIDQILQEAYPYEIQTRVTDQMSLIYIPQRLTANLMRKYFANSGVKIAKDDLTNRIFQELGDIEGDADAWYLVSNFPMRESIEMDDDEISRALRPGAFEWVTLRVLLFTIFVKCSWNKTMICATVPPLNVACQDTILQGWRVAISGFAEKQLKITSDVHAPTGVVVMKKV